MNPLVLSDLYLQSDFLRTDQIAPRKIKKTLVQQRFPAFGCSSPAILGCILDVAEGRPFTLQRSKTGVAPSAAVVDHPDSSVFPGPFCPSLAAKVASSAADSPADRPVLRVPECSQACWQAGRGLPRSVGRFALVERYSLADSHPRLQAAGSTAARARAGRG
jgi:hypothetical protein